MEHRLHHRLCIDKNVMTAGISHVLWESGQAKHQTNCTDREELGRV
jgi:hypothetical protein